MTIPISLKNDSYDIVIGKNILSEELSNINLNRKVMIVADSNLSAEVVYSVALKCNTPFIHYIKSNEESKTLVRYVEIMDKLVDYNFDRHDCVIALGGGMIGDLAGFVASTYMRGIDFYNIPTTLLSQVDSSIGGKTAINYRNYKNTVGSFYQPKKVIIDTNLLSTLPKREFNCGVIEAVKMAAVLDREFFIKLEHQKFEDDLENNITKALTIKKKIVEADEKESNTRKLLNFGHTFGHAMESYFQGDIYHGECVAVGMMPMCSAEVRDRIKKVLSLNDIDVLELFSEDSWCSILNNIKHDKKVNNNTIDLVKVDEIGNGYLENISLDNLYDLLGKWQYSANMNN